MGWAARTNPQSNEFARLSPAAQGLVEAQDGRVFAQASPEAEELTDQQRIRELAAQIRDEAHLQRILDDVRPQSVRALVEAQIRPWVTYVTPPDPPSPYPERTSAMHSAILPEPAPLDEDAWRDPDHFGVQEGDDAD